MPARLNKQSLLTRWPIERHIKGLEASGVTLCLSTRALKVVAGDGDLHRLEIEVNEAGETRIEQLEFDQLLVAVGRQANVEGLGLEELGVGTTYPKTLGEYLREDRG